MTTPNILIVDDEKRIRSSLTGIFEDEGYNVCTVQDGQAALQFLEQEQPDLMMLDLWMPGMDGLQVLEAVKQRHPALPVIVISGHGNIETAVKAAKLGAYDFLEKPLSLEKTLIMAERAIDQGRLLRENLDLKQRVERKYEMIGISKAMQDIRERIATAAPTNGRVLIYGENGAGKELIARALHRQSLRADKPFIEVNCAAIPQELIESELFGHEKGAFTGATTRKIGKIELAHEGTLFLDEIGDMSLATQAKVLRVLQEQKFERVGGTETLEADFRVFAASNKNLDEEIEQGRFREDLYYRLNVIPFYVPPLRERKEDIPLLARHFLEEISEENGRRLKTLAPDALEALMQYDWPGNIRELKNVMERLMIMVSVNTIRAEHISNTISGGRRKTASNGGSPLIAPPWKPLKDARNLFEKHYILQCLKAHDGNITKTAQTLEIERTYLHKKIRMLQEE
ncbi:two component, sigma54 specific, transcriptional regulator, Fis family [Candidatus Moduliflexus flocculans]|uniref:Two component, sigma54 specific, transcriptional regulator, Fis family n=1 Tax=Candidatus Moduliflexus flocculans TaxID=1499966 RepID=A0A081BQ75_9BACT|nr:two component, sigma54 specific, transcriptional regulator, Fis family [Candidatus Moduliflexus flocculans]